MRCMGTIMTKPPIPLLPLVVRLVARSRTVLMTTLTPPGVAVVYARVVLPIRRHKHRPIAPARGNLTRRSQMTHLQQVSPMIPTSRLGWDCSGLVTRLLLGVLLPILQTPIGMGRTL